jgi:flavin reductase (DIM6/NTAB) family NADH-FMN oxidoreductase RutF
MQKQVNLMDAVKTKYPEQVVIVISKDKDGRPNPITLCWAMYASYDPLMMAIAVAKGHYSAKTIKQAKCFTIAYPASNMAKESLFYGSVSGRKCDKFALMPAKISKSKKINSCILDDAVANFECQLVKTVPTGDHFIFVGKVVCAHKNTKTKKRLYVTGTNYKMGAFKS